MTRDEAYHLGLLPRCLRQLAREHPDVRRVLAGYVRGIYPGSAEALNALPPLVRDAVHAELVAQHLARGAEIGPRIVERERRLAEGMSWGVAVRVVPCAAYMGPVSGTTCARLAGDVEMFEAELRDRARETGR